MNREGYYDEQGKFRPACEADPEYWFPNNRRKHGIAQEQDAKRICVACPLREACLEIAMKAEGDDYESMRSGVYGGLSPADRTALAKRRGYTNPPVRYTSLFCQNMGHPKQAYFDGRICIACQAISEGRPVETLTERRLWREHRELNSEVRRVYHTAMTGNYAPKPGLGGFKKKESAA